MGCGNKCNEKGKNNSVTNNAFIILILYILLAILIGGILFY